MEKTLLWAAILTTFGVSARFVKDVKNEPIRLDLAPNSVDDGYVGCEDKMRNKVKKQYLDKELKNKEMLGIAWTKAGKFYETWVKKNKGPQYRHLQREHVMAVYVYSLENPKVYSDFNQVVRTKSAEYASPNFGYHALHFYLTEAIQTLNANTQAERCVTTYRRVDRYFTQDVLNKEIRFGAFTSSSMKTYPSAKIFGEKSCFEITSCFGADVTCCTLKGARERELLIPPYEVFKVTNIEKRSTSKGKKLPCEVVYTVQSTKLLLSNLNCALF